jgi:hypothetical protein
MTDLISCKSNELEDIAGGLPSYFRGTNMRFAKTGLQPLPRVQFTEAGVEVGDAMNGVLKPG